MQNLVQADMAYVQINRKNLIDRQFVIETGSTSKLRFGTPRTESGAIASLSKPFVTPPAIANDAVLRVEQQSVSKTWLDSFQPAPSKLTPSKLETVAAVAEYKNKWPNVLGSYEKEIASIQDQLTTLSNSITEQDRTNPLRKRAVKNVEQQKQTLEFKLKQLSHRFEILTQQAKLDQAALRQVLAHDVETFDRPLKPRKRSIDTNTVSHLLLADSQADYVNEVIHWFRWFRNRVPDPGTDFSPKAKRGVDVLMPGIEPKPTFLIESLDLDGEGHIAGQHFNFVGTVNHLTNSPELHSEPVSFHLRAQGRNHLIVDCVLDRRSEESVDTLNVEFPSLDLPSQTLGNQETLAVAMGPSQVRAEISLRVEGNQLSGELVFVHTDVLMHVSQVHELAGGEQTVRLINRDLAGVDKYQTYVQLSGTLEQPEFDFRSDLGDKFAASMNKVMARKVSQNQSVQMKDLSKRLSAEIASLSKVTDEALRGIADQLGAAQTSLSRLGERIAREDSAWPRIR